MVHYKYIAQKMGDFLENFKSEASSLLRNKKNVINILVLGILILGLPLGINLIRQQQLLKSRASVEPIVFTGANVTQKNGQWVVVDATKGISLELTSPLGPPAPPPSPPASPAVSPPPVVSPPPGPAQVTVSITANPSTVTAGQSTTLTWTSTNAVKCILNPPGVYKTVDPSGSDAFSPTETTTYNIRCEGPTGAISSVTASTTVTVNQSAPSWSANLLPSSMQNTTLTDSVAQKVQWFGPGTYSVSGSVSSTPKVQGNATSASIAIDEWTDGNSYVTWHGNNTTFTVPSGNKLAVILRAINADATFSNVSVTKEQEGNNIFSEASATVTKTRGAAAVTPTSLNQKYKIYGSVSGDGFLDVAEWTPYPNPVWQKSNRVGDPAFGVSALGNFLQVAYNVRSGSVTFSNVKFVEVTQSANQLSSDMQNATLSDPVTQEVQWFGPGTYKLSGSVTSSPVVQGNPTAAAISADEWTDGNSYVTWHGNNTTFTVPSGNKLAVILRAINAKATFSNVSLQKQQ